MAELDELVNLHLAGRSVDEILEVMKYRGLTITEAIKASMQVFNMGLGDAKSLVSSHQSWIQTARAAKPFQDELIKAFQEDNSVGTPAE
jgi:hypothetical protein